MAATRMLARTSSLLNLVNAFSHQRVLLIGDTILDVYVHGTAIGKSAETPTLVARYLRTERSLGGAFLVARNLLALGASVEFVTLAGDDERADYVGAFEHPRFTMSLVRDRGRLTTVKTRYWVDGYKLLQFDTLDNRPLAADLVAATLTHVERELPSCAAVVISDYRHGFLSPELIPVLLQLCRAAGKHVYVDSQLSQSAANHAEYRGASTICLNEREAHALDPEFDTGAAAPASLERLQALLGVTEVVVKLGEQGAVGLFAGAFHREPALRVIPIDTTGAGDAFLAALCLAGVAEPAARLALANHWAGLSTSTLGAQPPSLQELRSRLA